MSRPFTNDRPLAPGRGPYALANHVSAPAAGKVIRRGLKAVLPQVVSLFSVYPGWYYSPGL